MFSTIASIAGPILGAAISSGSASDAANTQAQSSQAATAEQARQYNQSRADMAPYRDVGSSALYRLRDLMGLGGSSGAVPTGGQDNSYDTIYNRLLANYDAQHQAKYGIPLMQSPDTAGVQSVLEQLQSQARNESSASQPAATAAAPNDPYQIFGNSPLTRRFTTQDFQDDPVVQLGLQFGLGEGTKAIDRMAGARGMRNSGATLKELTKFGNDYAGSQAGASRDRFIGDQTNIFNRLSGIAGTGQTAATQTASMGQNNAQNIGNILTAQGNAQGASQIAQGNAWGNAGNTIGNWFNQNNTLDKILQNRGGNNGGYSISAGALGGGDAWY